MAIISVIRDNYVISLSCFTSYRRNISLYVCYYMNKEELAMNFWGRVEIAQREAGISTFKQVCETAGIHYQSMANKRSLSTLPNLETAVAIARVVSKPVEWLLLGDLDVDVATRADVLKAIDSNDRFYEIAKRLVSASQSQVYALEVLLRMKNDKNNGGGYNSLSCLNL